MNSKKIVMYVLLALALSCCVFCIVLFTIAYKYSKFDPEIKNQILINTITIEIEPKLNIEGFNVHDYVRLRNVYSERKKITTIKNYGNNMNDLYLASYEILLQEWKIFKEKHHKKYVSDEEDLKRMEVFSKNRLAIEKHNKFYEKGLFNYTVKMNKFGDLTADEFYAKHKLDFVNYEKEIDDQIFLPPILSDKTGEVDWRQKGAVTEVKNEEECKSSWAFSAAGALEGHYFKHNNYLLELSKQNLIDCSKKNLGCKGGWPKLAFEYIKQMNGIDTEKSYPYTHSDGKCSYNPAYATPSATMYYNLKPDEYHLQQNVAFYGPISVVVDTLSDPMFRFYESGVFYSHKCTQHYLNHAMLVVGYGVDPHGGSYWLVKNSWGKDWGEEGYVRMSKDRNNNCGIVSEAILPYSE